MTGIARPATAEDAEAIGHVHYEAHVETYSGHIPAGAIEGFPPEQRSRMWRRTIEEGLGDVWVAEVDGQVVGFASTLRSRDENPPRELELGAIYLQAAHHGSGLGQALLDAAIGDRPASLWVLDENPRAIAFYRRNGFEADGADKLDERWGNIREIRLVR
ncbi:GNAT superfamily N-acetyltransferase [Cryobacterium mesophilum]|uniref:GNAT family N-acetyltransferase n=1 Tax=Terrimesophilobacter mesophilus TaxID=433647 RepID=A0A4R8V987_9MICO|nr:GNAT family N-acetyltransferase [Terrimesophilobacter mesophilus]MBB5631989.1 GNAT superfamily N-acetyltransferase [Terrimesophilobacter mesophilus]TFB78886.1 GNAT family N-acetyltransferase [Terrimesophilobacter mesophilus]